MDSSGNDIGDFSTAHGGLEITITAPGETVNGTWKITPGALITDAYWPQHTVGNPYFLLFYLDRDGNGDPIYRWKLYRNSVKRVVLASGTLENLVP